METLKTKDNMVTEINNQVVNAVSSFFYYMWNAWSEDECKVVYGEDVPSLLGKMEPDDGQGHIRGR